MIRRLVDITYKMARRIVVLVIGGTLLLFGVVMLFTPGPGLAGIAAGLAVLAIEFTWARAWLRKVREKMSDAGDSLRRRSIDRHRDRAGDGARDKTPRGGS